jgi:thiamine pyrophosphate-dependent acetolactate synthase large subunit-like protein
MSDNIGVATTGRGPAIAQTGTALVNANKGGSELLVIVPIPTAVVLYEIKEFAQREFLESTIGNVIVAESHETLLPRTREAFRRLEIGDGPIALAIPDNFLNSTFENDEEFDAENVLDFSLAEGTSKPPTLEPHPEQISACVDMYLDSDATKAPVIIAGRGVVQADAKDAVVNLAERINAFLATSLQGRGLFDDHPYSVGFVGDLGNNLANSPRKPTSCWPSVVA